MPLSKLKSKGWNYFKKNPNISATCRLCNKELKTSEPSTMAETKEVQEAAAVDLGALLDAGDDAMVTLIAGDRRLVAHRAVLAAKSPVFAAMFSHDTLEASSGEVTIPDVEGPVLHQLLAYIYSRQAPQLPSMAAKLLVAADKYGMSGLKSQCERQLVIQLNVENAAAAAVLAVRHSCLSLVEAAVAFINANPQVLTTQGWSEAVLSQPQDVAEVSRLLAETSAATAGSRTPPYRIPPDPADVSRMRSLSEEERSRRLIHVAGQGAVEDLRALLAAGVDVEVKDKEFDYMTALHWAAVRGHAEAVTCLVEGGAEVDAKDSMKCTPLHCAAYRGHMAVVQVLLAFSADPNAKNHWKRTPLHDAAEQGHAEVAAALLEAGADKSVRADNWNTPLDLARQNNRKQLIQMLS